VAKKAKKRMEEETTENAFEFPVFDEGQFIAHELEQTIATGIAIAVAIALGVLSFGLSRLLTDQGPGILAGVVPLVVSIAIIALSPFLVQRLRPAARDYTRGDWASLILLELFGWLGIWFLLTDVFFR
jgi:hypothetical protein